MSEYGTGLPARDELCNVTDRRAGLPGQERVAVLFLPSYFIVFVLFFSRY